MWLWCLEVKQTLTFSSKQTEEEDEKVKLDFISDFKIMTKYRISLLSSGFAEPGQPVREQWNVPRGSEQLPGHSKEQDVQQCRSVGSSASFTVSLRLSVLQIRPGDYFM